MLDRRPVDEPEVSAQEGMNMNPPLAFVSYDIESSVDDLDRFIGEIGSCSRTFNVDDWSVERMSPREEWDKIVRSKIGRCDFLIVLVAAGMKTAPVEHEIVLAKRSNVPFFGIYVGDAKPGVELPPGLPANRTIPCDWGRIAAAINQVTKEGKHHEFV
jgi:hypothetical protein